MDEPQNPKARRWPLAIMAAFVAGAVLWGLWMYKLVRETRSRRDNTFFVPPPEQKLPAATNAPAPAVTPTNPPK